MARPGGLWLDPDDLSIVRAGLVQARELIEGVAQQIEQAAGSVHLDHPATHVLSCALMLSPRTEPIVEIQRAVASVMGAVHDDRQPVAKTAFEALVMAYATVEVLKDRGVIRSEDQDGLNRHIQAKALELGRRLSE